MKHKSNLSYNNEWSWSQLTYCELETDVEEKAVHGWRKLGQAHMGRLVQSKHQVPL